MAWGTFQQLLKAPRKIDGLLPVEDYLTMRKGLTYDIAEAKKASLVFDLTNLNLVVLF